MATTSKYWAKREARVREAAINRSINETEERLKQLHLKVADKYIEKLELLANKIEQGRLKSQTPYYEYRRYYELMASLQKDLARLGTKEIKTLDESLTKTYREAEQIVGRRFNTPPASEATVNTIISEAWPGDGKRFSDRVWEHTGQLEAAIQEGMMKVFNGAMTPDELKKELQHDFSVSYFNASRITRTEVVHTANTAAVTTMKEAGIKQYKWVASDDERMCEICGALDGQVFDIDEIDKLPPQGSHAQCRCTVVAVFN